MKKTKDLFMETEQIPFWESNVSPILGYYYTNYYDYASFRDKRKGVVSNGGLKVRKSIDYIDGLELQKYVTTTINRKYN